MTRPTSFSYRSGASWIHQLDVRVKLAALLVLTLLSVQFSWHRLIVLAAVLLWAITHLGLTIPSVIRELRLFFLFLLMIFTLRVLSAAGMPDFFIGPFAVRVQGVVQGAVVCLRLFFIVLLGLIFMASTRPNEIKRAVEWFLIPFPFIPGRRVATMLGLLLRFIPVIFTEAADIADAQRARGIESRKNPVYRMIKLAIPLVRRTFLRAEKLALAMEARCYQETRTDPKFAFSKKDGMFLVVFSVLMLSSLML